VHWISIPVHIGDPISVAYGSATWRVMFEKIRPIDLCAASHQVARLFLHPGVAIADKDTVGVGGWLENGTSLSKSHPRKAHLWDVH